MSETSVFDWQNIFDSTAGCDVQIRRRNGIEHGVILYAEPENCRAVLLNYIRSNPPEPSVRLTLMLPGSAAISPGDTLTWENTEYEVQAVERCIAISGAVIAHRCSVTL